MPLGWHRVKLLYSEYKTEVEMDKMRGIQRCVPPNFVLKYGNGVHPQEQDELEAPQDLA